MGLRLTLAFITGAVVVGANVHSAAPVLKYAVHNSLFPVSKFLVFFLFLRV